MAFKIKKNEIVNFSSPQEMYADYKNRKINGPINYQSDMLTKYMSEGFNQPDVAFELPTGSGKTLIGLIIGEYRRRKNQEKVVYLCPNNQLVHQVGEQSTNKFGIKVHTFTGRQKDYDSRAIADFMSGRVIAVTNYSSLFAYNTFFSDVDTIIFDDAHSAEDYIADNWSVKIRRNEFKDLFKVLVENFKEIIEVTQYNRMCNDEPSTDDLLWTDKIPNTKFLAHSNHLIPIIDTYLKETNLRFSWVNIKDNLHACNVYLSWSEILIRPFIPPTLTNAAFSNAKHRIYMSATLGESGELQRITGVSDIVRLKMIDGWDKKGFGRRFFMFPENSFPSEKNTEVLLKLVDQAKRSLILVQEGSFAEKVSETISTFTSKTVFSSKDIELSKENFVKSDNAVAILANRFDGIDMCDDDCRLLIIHGLPRATHLQEKFLINRLAANVLFQERIKTRIVQAVGRCTRGPVDYAAVCIFSHDLINSLISPKRLELFHPEMQAEIEFGYEQSLEHEDIDSFLENLHLFFKRGEEWNEAEEAIVSKRDEIITKSDNDQQRIVFDKLRKSSKHEVKFQYSLWKRDFDEAFAQIELILTHLNGDELKGYRGFWNYIGGCVAHQLSLEGNQQYNSLYKSYLKNAQNCTSSITWFGKLAMDESNIDLNSEETNYVVDIIERIEEQIQKDGIRSHKKFESRVQRILESLNSDNGDKFEQGHKELGELMGYISENPQGNAEPDPWWLINESICIVSEDKVYQTNEKPIATKDVRQASTHETWIREKVKSLKPNADVLTIMITNTTYIEAAATTYAKDIWYVNKYEFYNWGVVAVEGIRRLRRTFTDQGNLLWRMEASKILEEMKLTPKDFLEFITRKKLDNLETR